jgi:hypothetical protein
LRDCGDCTLCCKVIHVETLKKPAGEWCKHCALGRTSGGCTIFGQPDRPYECGKFQCMWTRHYDWPDSMKPSKSRMVFERVDNRIILATCDTQMPDAWKSNVQTKRFIKKLVLGGNAVVINAWKEKHTLLPKGMTNKQVWDKLQAEHDRWQRQATQRT